MIYLLSFWGFCILAFLFKFEFSRKLDTMCVYLYHMILFWNQNYQHLNEPWIQIIFNQMNSQQPAQQKLGAHSGVGKHLVAVTGSTFQHSGANYLLLNNAIMWKKYGYKITIICQDRDAKNLPVVDDYIQGSFPADSRKLKQSQLRIVVPDINNLIPTYTAHKVIDFEGVSCKPISEMTEEEIQTNINMTVKCLRAVCLHDRPYKVLSQFMILSGIICRRALEDLDIPYDIFIPGPALKYVVMPHPNLWKWVLPAFENATVIYHRTQFVKQLNLKVFKKQAAQYKLKQKARAIGPGLDIQLYQIPESYEKAELEFLEKVKKFMEGHENEVITEKLRNYGRSHATEKNEKVVASTFTDIIKLDLLGKWLPYDEKDETVLYLGAIMDKMGVAELILLFTKLITERPSLKLIVSGVGPLKQPMMQYIRALYQGDLQKAKQIIEKVDLAEQINPIDYLTKIEKRVSDRIIFTGLLDAEAIAKLMPLCTVYLAPGKLPQQCNLSIIEALSFGLTPICNERCYLLQFMDAIEKDYPELAQVARTQHDEFFTKLPTTVVNTLQFIKNNKLNKKQYRAKLRQIARRNFSWEHTATALANQNKIS